MPTKYQVLQPKYQVRQPKIYTVLSRGNFTNRLDPPPLFNNFIKKNRLLLIHIAFRASYDKCDRWIADDGIVAKCWRRDICPLIKQARPQNNFLPSTVLWYAERISLLRDHYFDQLDRDISTQILSQQQKYGYRWDRNMTPWHKY